MASTAHEMITSAGWTYRMNERGWVIYREPNTGTWYTRADALVALGATLDPEPAATEAQPVR